MAKTKSWSPWPSRAELGLALVTLSRKQRWAGVGLLLLLVVAVIMAIAAISRHYSVPVSAVGGSLTEGLIGTPRFINPLLATSDADRDLTTLIYSGLLRIDDNGQLIPDLAAGYQMSDNSLIYTFTLKPGLTWSDGSPLTADDVAFTIAKAQDPAIKSPRRASWEGVKVKVIDPLTLTLELKQPYPALLDNATMGILPKHLWENFDAETFALNQFNSEGVGSGPYQIATVKKNKLGIPEFYDLRPFKYFALGPAKISQLRLRFYNNTSDLIQAYHQGEIESFGAIPAEQAATLEQAGARILKIPLPRVFGVFFNQNRAPVLANLEVRQALDQAIDKTALVTAVLHGYGVVANSPIPFLDPGPANASSTPTTASTTPPLDQARATLTAKGWVWDQAGQVWQKTVKKVTQTLTLTLSTADTPELKQAAELVKADWEKLGVPVDLRVFEIGDLNQNIIRPRQYDAVLFGEILGRRPDPFAFWHSSQRLDPGLNIALYTNQQADKLLETIRATTDQPSLLANYQKFNTLITADQPAIFLYSPYFLYLAPASVQGLSLVPVNTPSERFLNIYRWYINTDRVWPIFSNNFNRLNSL